MQPRNEYPRPQLVRPNWQNLNGEWQFEFDDEDRGLTEGWFCEKDFSGTITVPYVYQSKLSGINDQTPHDIVWYQKRIKLNQPESTSASGLNNQNNLKAILHFGAVDYEAQIFVNGHKVAVHEGGHTPFSCDITPFLSEGEQIIAVRACDPHKDEEIPRGKQFWEDQSRAIWYTNSTGIWQTVWVEWVHAEHISRLRFTSDFEEGKVNIFCEKSEWYPAKKAENLKAEESKADSFGKLEYSIRFQDKKVAAGILEMVNKQLSFDVELIQNHIFRTNFHDSGWAWTPERPNLFTVELILKSAAGEELDQVSSYFGFRKVHTENGMVFLNNKPYYQKLVLDQGYWPEGLLTAPEDDDYRKDITVAKEMGFNGCRKHQKMEDPRFLYWADQLGFLVWGECAAPPVYSTKSVERLMKEWTEAVERDYNHPSIITWVPINESWGVPHIHQCVQQQNFSLAMYYYLHALDRTRLVVSNDGWEMTKTDICAIHNYRHGQKEDTAVYDCYRETLSTAENLTTMPSTDWSIYAKGFHYEGEPILLTEYGGIGFDQSGEKGWGYTSVTSEEEFLEDYSRIMDAIYASRALWGYCYTQLYDVEQEINGMLTYDRKPKCELQKIKQINQRRGTRLKG